MSRDHQVTCVAWKKILAAGAETQVRETEGHSVCPNRTSQGERRHEVGEDVRRGSGQCSLWKGVRLS